MEIAVPDFDFVIKNLQIKKKNFHDFGKIYSSDKRSVYRIIYNW